MKRENSREGRNKQKGTLGKNKGTKTKEMKTGRKKTEKRKKGGAVEKTKKMRGNNKSATASIGGKVKKRQR